MLLLLSYWPVSVIIVMVVVVVVVIGSVKDYDRKVMDNKHRYWNESRVIALCGEIRLNLALKIT